MTLVVFNYKQRIHIYYRALWDYRAVWYSSQNTY